MNKAEYILEKIAKEEKSKTYPMSRGIMMGSNLSYYGATRPLHARASQGRKNIGAKGVTASEQRMLDGIQAEDNDKTYPIARAMTSVPGAAAMTGLSAGYWGKRLAGKKGAGVAAAGAALGAGSVVTGRAVHSRAQLGRARVGRVGTLPTDVRQLAQLKEKKAEYILEKIAKEDNRPEAGYWATGMANQRAMRRGNKGVAKHLATNEVIGGRMHSGLIGALQGGAIGAGVGAAAGLASSVVSKGKLGPGLGAALGGLGGVVVGDAVGQYKADKKYLGDRGIKLRAAGFRKAKLTDEAKKKYLSSKYKGGGYAV